MSGIEAKTEYLCYRCEIAALIRRMSIRRTFLGVITAALAFPLLTT